jgi:hypothetical protein
MATALLMTGKGGSSSNPSVIRLRRLRCLLTVWALSAAVVVLLVEFDRSIALLLSRPVPGLWEQSAAKVLMTLASSTILLVVTLVAIVGMRLIAWSEIFGSILWVGVSVLALCHMVLVATSVLIGGRISLLGAGVVLVCGLGVSWIGLASGKLP